MNTVPSNESLIQALYDAASELSYFNAAEGDAYRWETGARRTAQHRWDALKKEAIGRGVYNKDDFRNYLV